MPRSNGSAKSMFGGTGLTNSALLSQYLAEMKENTSKMKQVKNVEDLQKMIDYYNSVVTSIDAKKKSL
jgi:hypothetical protein